MNKLGIFGIVIAAIAVVGFFIPRYWVSPTRVDDHKIHVVASFYPMAFFASSIAGDLADVRTITPSGVEPHDYELSPADINAMQQADIIVVNGTVEPWIQKLQDTFAGSHVQIITASSGLIRQSDPHVWLDPVLAQQEVATIARALEKRDSVHAAEYEAHAQQLIKSLQDLDASYRLGLAYCTGKQFVTSHAAFAYIAARYGLEQISIAGLSPNEEPSIKQLADVARVVHQNNIHYIFFESLVSPKLADTIATETGATTLELNPIEGLTLDQERQGQDYFSIMKHNLDNLQRALSCR